MKKIFIFVITFFATISATFAEQYVLQCTMNIEAVNTATNEVMKRSTIQRYFIIDTLLAQVYDANNLPLEVDGFNDDEIIFHHKAASFNTIVDTRVTYNRLTNEMKLNEIYANSAYSNRAQWVTRGEGTCLSKEIERKPVFF